MVLLLFLRLIIRFKIRTVATFVLMEYPAAIQSSGGNGADKNKRQNSFEATHAGVCISNIRKEMFSLIRNVQTMVFLLFHS
jgi:hypothetical protein